jgi:hypothetical protein
MKFLLCTISILLLSACTLSPTATLVTSSQRYETHNDIMFAWVNRSEGDLIAHWGQPDQVKQNSANSKILMFRKQNPFSIIACTSAFQIEQGRVTKWGHRGCPIRDNKVDYKLLAKDTVVPQATLSPSDF